MKVREYHLSTTHEFLLKETFLSVDVDEDTLKLSVR